MPTDDQPISEITPVKPTAGETVAGIINYQYHSDVSLPTLSDLATISHQKGDVRMITLTSDKIDMLLSATGSLSSNFLTLTIGIAAAIFMALKSGGVEESWRATFWVAFWFSLLLVVFFGILTAAQEIKKYKLRQEFKGKKTV